MIKAICAIIPFIFSQTVQSQSEQNVNEARRVGDSQFGKRFKTDQMRDNHPEFLLFTTDSEIKAVQLIADDEGFLDSKSDIATTLISGLDKPTYLDYSAEFKELFVCETGTKTILHFDLRINEGVLKSSEKQILIRDIECGGIQFDKFHNMLFVDTKKSQINKIPYEEISIHNTKFGTHQDGGSPDPSFYMLYSEFIAKEVHNVVPISVEIDEEFLFWGNKNVSNIQGGAIHMAFTEPFVKAIPFQTYQFQNLASVQSISTNHNFVFFIGELSDDVDNLDGDPQLFIQLKQSRIFDHVRVGLGVLNRPTAVLTYQDTALLIANQGFISQVDLSQQPIMFKKEHLVSLGGAEHIYDMTFVSKQHYYDERQTYEEMKNDKGK